MTTRRSTQQRVTKETTVEVSVDLDGSGTTAITTGVGMFDHLLSAFGHHRLIDLELTTEGDLHIDDHHTVEDSMLVLGAAIDEALGDRSGIVRYGDARVPMDEAIASCTLDFGGRPYAVIDAEFRGEKMGTLSTQMIPHALESFARTARATIHLSGSGRNDHHVAEAMFKALARATRAAVAIDERRRGIPSTKGTL